jgi:hypothetical protein
MFVNKGADGFFVEFPFDSYRWFTDLGNQSRLVHEHPEHKLEDKDLNLEIDKVCIADRYKHECMSNETLFGSAVRKNAFLEP